MTEGNDDTCGNDETYILICNETKENFALDVHITDKDARKYDVVVEFMKSIQNQTLKCENSNVNLKQVKMFIIPEIKRCIQQKKYKYSLDKQKFILTIFCAETLYWTIYRTYFEVTEKEIVSKDELTTEVIRLRKMVAELNTLKNLCRQMHVVKNTDSSLQVRAFTSQHVNFPNSSTDNAPGVPINSLFRIETNPVDINQMWYGLKGILLIDTSFLTTLDERIHKDIIFAFVPTFEHTMCSSKMFIEIKNVKTAQDETLLFQVWRIMFYITVEHKYVHFKIEEIDCGVVDRQNNTPKWNNVKCVNLDSNINWITQQDAACLHKIANDCWSGYGLIKHPVLSLTVGTYWQRQYNPSASRTNTNRRVPRHQNTPKLPSISKPHIVKPVQQIQMSSNMFFFE